MSLSECGRTRKDEFVSNREDAAGGMRGRNFMLLVGRRSIALTSAVKNRNSGKAGYLCVAAILGLLSMQRRLCIVRPKSEWSFGTNI